MKLFCFTFVTVHCLNNYQNNNITIVNIKVRIKGNVIITSLHPHKMCYSAIVINFFVHYFKNIIDSISDTTTTLQQGQKHHNKLVESNFYLLF